MNQQSPERLYHLLPAIYRQRDAAQGEPLRALMAVMETELEEIEADIEGLYENWFIQTCDEWVVPYIADLLWISSLSDRESTRLSHRSYVANTIAYRRRKGGSAILESITLDVTRWRSKIVECFDGVSVTQRVNHVRSNKGSTLDIRNKTTLDQLNSPFDSLSHTVDVRRIASQYPIRGQSNVLNLGLFVWRLQSYPMQKSSAVDLGGGHYAIHPLGQDTPLFNRPQTKTDITQRTEAIHLPCPISVEAFTADLQEYKAQYQKIAPQQQPPNSKFYGTDRSLYIIKDDVPVPPMQVVSLRLADGQQYELGAGQIAIDVERGRLVVPPTAENSAPPGLEISYCYGFSGDIGGGPYDRHSTLADRSAEKIWSVLVGRKETLQSLEAALANWESQPERQGVIQMTDNGIYGSADRPLTITLPEASQLTLEASDGTRAAIQSTNIVVTAMGAGASLTLNGLLIKGRLTIQGNLNLNLIHCTVLGGIQAEPTVNLQATIA
ncbi:MAG TPA: hypothetical protein V6C85_04780, partial [Allocoleopsis sp.]